MTAPALIIRNNDDGSLDEVCAAQCQFHLEQMSTTHWWMEVEVGAKRVHVNLHSRKKISANISDESDAAPAPPAQDITALIERLRYIAGTDDARYSGIDATLHEAMDALAAQAGEIAELQKANDQLYEHGKSMFAERKAAEAALADAREAYSQGRNDGYEQAYDDIREQS